MLTPTPVHPLATLPDAVGARTGRPPHEPRRATAPTTHVPTLTTDLAVVARNTRALAAVATRLMAVVKADAFGHGPAVAATVLSHGATSLGVATAAEAIALRDAGISAPILCWLLAPGADMGGLVDRGIAVAVSSRLHLVAVADAAARSGRTAMVHLHIDTGMARDGAPWQQWPELCTLAAHLEASGRIRVDGVMGHLPCAEVPGHPTTGSGRAVFDAAVALAQHHGLRPRLRHLAATAATLGEPSTRYDMSRVGAGLFGIVPGRSSGDTAGLRPALTLTAPVVVTRDVPAGTGVGYGHTWVSSRPTRLALVPLGYADGIPRVAGPQASVLVRGRRCPVVGAVSMDQLVIDVGDARVQAGERVTVFGPGDSGEPTAADWARWAGTIEHEIVTGIGQRVARAVTRCPSDTPPPTGQTPTVRLVSA